MAATGTLQPQRQHDLQLHSNALPACQYFEQLRCQGNLHKQQRVMPQNLNELVVQRMYNSKLPALPYLVQGGDNVGAVTGGAAATAACRVTRVVGQWAHIV
jgi:hypothetical protein